MILSNIKEFLGRNKKVFYYIFLFFIVSFLISDSTFATQVGDATATTGGGLFTKEGFIEALNVGMQMLGVLLALATYLATLFLSPEWINGSLFGLSKNFKEIWIMVSNLVYFVFAFILIWIAFMNIIGKNTDQYQLKQALPKFIVGVLIVPFSWFLVQFILSISAILTISALTLPFDTFEQYGDKMKSVEIPNSCILNLTELKTGDKQTGDKQTGNENKGQLISCTDKTSQIIGGNSTQSIFGVMSLYTYGILQFDKVDDIQFGSVDDGSVNTMGDILVKVLFDTIFVIVYSILIIALALVLMIRGIYIWIYTMMSPIFGLMYFFDKKDGGGDGFFGKFNLKEFISLAMVPVYTMLALSFGLLFLYVIGNGISNPDPSNDIKIINEKKGESSLNLDGFTLTIKGAVSGIGASDITNFLDVAGGEGKGALGVIGTLILKIFGIIILWGAVMAALRSSDVTKAIVEPLHQFGTKVGGIVSSAPGNVPIFGGQSMNSMGNIANAGTQSITRMNTDRSQGFLDKHHLFGGGKGTKEFRNLESTIKNTNGDSRRQVAAMHKIFNAANGDTKLLYTDSEAQKRLFELSKEMKVNLPDTIKKASDINSSTQLEKLINAIENKDPVNFKNIISSKAGGNIKIGDIDKEVKDKKDYTNNSNISNANGGITSQTSSEDGRILNVTLNNQKIMFDDKENIKDGSFDNFARSINGLNYDDAKSLFDSQGIKDFDKLFDYAKNKLGNDALKKNSAGIIEIDLSKRNK